MERYQPLSIQNKEEGFNFQEYLDSIIIYWKWILLCVIISFFCAFFYLRYSVPLYSASTSIMVRDDRKGGLQSELSAFSDLALPSVKSSVDNEIEILRSRTIVQKVVKKLNFNVTYLTEGRIKTIELYKDSPVIFNFIVTNDSFYDRYDTFFINSISKDSFELLDGNKKKLGNYNYNDVIISNNCKIIVSKNYSGLNKNNSFAIQVNVAKLLDVALNYKSRITIDPLGKNTSILELKINDPIKEKSQDFLDTLLEVYNFEAIEDKNYIAKKTIDFIENRIKLIASELGDVEKGEEGFKKYNKLNDIDAESLIYMQNSVDLEKNIIQSETELIILNSLSSFIKTMNNGDLLPNNVIPSDGEAIGLIEEYNSLVLTKNRLIKEGTRKSSVLENFDQKSTDLLQAINQSLSTLKTNLRIRKREFEKQMYSNDNKISLIPTQSRELRVIERQQKIKETLYIYLLQKREETAITLAVTAPNAKIIDKALYSKTPVSPNKNSIYLFALAIGFSIPIGIIILKKLLDTKVKNRQDIESLTTIPFVGDVPRSDSGTTVINATSRSSAAEAIRIARTNLEFFLGQVPENQAKTIFLTSTLPKEGKTFLAVNLSSTLAISNKKVLLIGLDIRNPQIDKYLDLPPNGVSNFLSKQNENIDDYLVKIKGFENFYVLPAGTIPPNPVELLMNKKVDVMFSDLKSKFDYIVVDTAPVSLVTDTLLIAKNADMFLYVVRANYLDKRLLNTAEAFYKEKKLPNMSIILNDTIWDKRYGYGYTYGYGNSRNKESLYKKFFKKIFKP